MVKSATLYSEVGSRARAEYEHREHLCDGHPKDQLRQFSKLRSVAPQKPGFGAI